MHQPHRLALHPHAHGQAEHGPTELFERDARFGQGLLAHPLGGGFQFNEERMHRKRHFFQFPKLPGRVGQAAQRVHFHRLVVGQKLLGAQVALKHLLVKLGGPARKLGYRSHFQRQGTVLGRFGPARVDHRRLELQLHLRIDQEIAASGHVFARDDSFPDDDLFLVDQRAERHPADFKPARVGFHIDDRMPAHGQHRVARDDHHLGQRHRAIGIAQLARGHQGHSAHRARTGRVADDFRMHRGNPLAGQFRVVKLR